MSWVNKEATLFEVNGDEPSIFPEQITVRAVWINSEKSVQFVYPTKLLNLTASNFINTLGELITSIPNQQGKYTNYPFKEALLFSVPMANIGSTTFGASYISCMATQCSKIITADQISNRVATNVIPLLYSPQVMHQCSCIWLFFQEPLPPPIALELLPDIANIISALRPGRRTQRRRY